MQNYNTNIQTYIFDAYGTLFDVHSAVTKHHTQIGQCATELSSLWRTKQLEYTWVRSLMGKYINFYHITEQSLDFALAKYNINNNTLRNSLLEAYETLDPYPEVHSVLSQLRQLGHTIIILSNGTLAMLQNAVNSAGLSNLIDDIISVDSMRVYKTSPSTYRLCTDVVGESPESISFQSSNRWDIAGAKKFGFRCVWINRTNQPNEYTDLEPDSVSEDLHILLANQ